jgi:hypothetical protein
MRRKDSILEPTPERPDFLGGKDKLIEMYQNSAGLFYRIDRFFFVPWVYRTLSRQQCNSRDHWEINRISIKLETVSLNRRLSDLIGTGVNVDQLSSVYIEKLQKMPGQQMLWTPPETEQDES